MRPTLTLTKRSLLALALLAVPLAASPSAQAAGPRPLFQMPVPCGQTWEASTYSAHWNGDPDAIDLAQRDQRGDNISEGEPALASAAGTVKRIYTKNDEHRIVIDHGGGWITWYIHVEQLPPLKVGQFVAQGEQIGRISNSGTESMHLHYGQELDGEHVRVKFAGNAIQTHAGNRSSYGTYGDGERLTSANCPGDAVLSFNQNGMRYHLAYRPGDGAVGIGRLAADGKGSTPVWWGEWDRRVTHLTPFTLAGGQQHLFTYKSSTGTVQFHRLNSQGNGTTPVWGGTWGKGWTHFMPFSLDGKPYFLAYNSLYGNANLDRINAEGTGSTTLSELGWTTGWTHLAPYVSGGEQYVIAYKGGTGAVKILKIGGSGNAVSISTVWSGSWTKGLSHVVPMKHKGAVHLLRYKATTGLAQLQKLNADGQGTQSLGSATWSKTWTSFSPFLIDGVAHILGYKVGSGKAAMIKLNTAGTDTSTIWTGSWGAGLT